MVPASTGCPYRGLTRKTTEPTDTLSPQKIIVTPHCITIQPQKTRYHPRRPFKPKPPHHTHPQGKTPPRTTTPPAEPPRPPHVGGVSRASSTVLSRALKEGPSPSSHEPFRHPDVASHRNIRPFAFVSGGRVQLATRTNQCSTQAIALHP